MQSKWQFAWAMAQAGWARGGGTTWPEVLSAIEKRIRNLEIIIDSGCWAKEGF